MNYRVRRLSITLLFACGVMSLVLLPEAWKGIHAARHQKAELPDVSLCTDNRRPDHNVWYVKHLFDEFVRCSR